MQTIEITGHRQHEAWAAKTFPPVEEVRPGLWSIPVPMPGSPLRYVLVYALVLSDGGLALIDVGWESEESWLALVDGVHATGHDISDIRFAAVTHLHPDHFGLVPRLLEHTDAELAMHRNDAQHLRHHSEEELERQLEAIRVEVRRLGAPPDVGDRVMPIVRLPDGREIDIELDHGTPLNLPGWNIRAVWTPGHTAGHLCFADDDAGVIFTGDHLLPRISPNISTGPHDPNSPLADYLTSLANTESLGDLESLPSHEYRFRGLAGRVNNLLSHHEDRLAEITAAVVREPEATAWDITRSVTWSRPFAELGPQLSRLALRETNAHLLVLAERGTLTATAGSVVDDEPIRWSIPATV